MLLFYDKPKNNKLKHEIKMKIIYNIPIWNAGALYIIVHKIRNP